MSGAETSYDDETSSNEDEPRVTAAADLTRSSESSRAETPRVDVARLRKPLYVALTEKLCNPFGWRTYLSQWIVRVAISRNDVINGRPATLRWNSVMSAAYERVRATGDRLVPLSITVFEQEAARMPVDVALTPLWATRAYVVRARENDEQMAVEIMASGQAYMQPVCNLAFCSMHAIDFDASVVDDFVSATRDDDAPIVVPKTYRYAELLRQVTMARQLEAMEPLQRRCATATSLDHAPMETSSSWRYDNRRAFLDAVEYVRRVAAPPSANRVAEPYRMRCEPASGQVWAEALGPAVVDEAGPRHFEATVRFGVFFCRVPRRRH